MSGATIGATKALGARLGRAGRLSPDRDAGRWRWIERSLVALALVVLATRCAEALAVLVQSEPLNPDVRGFLAGARRMSWFYDTGEREPLYCAVLRLGLMLSNDGERVARWTSVLSSVAAGGALWLLGRRVFGSIIAMAALVLFAINPVVAWYGGSGLRAPLYTALLLLLAWLLPARRHASMPWLVAAGVTAAAVVLLRQHAVPVIAGILLLDFLLQRPWREASRAPALRRLAIVSGVAFALVLPDAFVEHEEVGRAANFWRNVEQHGHPADWREEPAIGSIDFLLADRSVLEAGLLVARNGLAYAWQYLPSWLRGYELAWLLLPVGIVAAVLTRRGWVAVMLLLALGPMVAILHVDQVPGAVGVERRFVYQCFPFALLLILLGAAWLVERLATLLARRSLRGRALHAVLHRVLLAPGAAERRGRAIAD